MSEELLPNDRHSYFQLRYFVLGKEPTMQAKMHRCQQELDMREQEIDSIKNQIGEFKDLNEISEIKISKMKGDGIAVRTRMEQRKVQARDKKIIFLERRLKGVEEEISFFKESLSKYSQKEPLKPWDDYEVQMEYWSVQLSQEINQRLILGLPVNLEVFKTVLCLPESPIKSQVMALLENRIKSLESLKKKEELVDKIVKGK